MNHFFLFGLIYTFAKMNNMEIGKMTISEALPHLKSVAFAYGLRLNRAKEFKMARIILVNLYSRELV
jgi:hypothetical protein